MTARSDNSAPDAGLGDRGDAPHGGSAAISLDVVEEDDDWRRVAPEAAPLAREAFEAAVRAGLDHRGLAAAGALEACLVLGDDALLARLNATWRGREGPTNILSFPAFDSVSDGDRAPLFGHLGDMAIAHGVAAREAAAAHKPLIEHLRHLTVHGALHLLGYDHEADEEAAEMEALETAILTGLGAPAPYGGRSRP